MAQARTGTGTRAAGAAASTGTGAPAAPPANTQDVDAQARLTATGTATGELTGNTVSSVEDPRTADPQAAALAEKAARPAPGADDPAGNLAAVASAPLAAALDADDDGDTGAPVMLTAVSIGERTYSPERPRDVEDLPGVLTPAIIRTLKASGALRGRWKAGAKA